MLVVTSSIGFAATISSSAVIVSWPAMPSTTSTVSPLEILNRVLCLAAKYPVGPTLRERFLQLLTEVREKALKLGDAGALRSRAQRWGIPDGPLELLMPAQSL